MNLPTVSKQRLLNSLGDLVIALTVAAQLSYELGAVADILPPEVKKWTSIGGIVIGVLLKTIQFAINVINQNK